MQGAIVVPSGVVDSISVLAADSLLQWWSVLRAAEAPAGRRGIYIIKTGKAYNTSVSHHSVTYRTGRRQKPSQHVIDDTPPRLDTTSQLDHSCCTAAGRPMPPGLVPCATTAVTQPYPTSCMKL